MPTFDADDIAELFDDDNYTDRAIVGTASVWGFFSNGYAATLDMEGEAPHFVCSTDEADDQSIAQGTTVTIDDVAYTVTSRQDTSSGVTLLMLHEA